VVYIVGFADVDFAAMEMDGIKDGICGAGGGGAIELLGMITKDEEAEDEEEVEEEEVEEGDVRWMGIVCNCCDNGDSSC